MGGRGGMAGRDVERVDGREDVDTRQRQGWVGEVGRRRQVEQGGVQIGQRNGGLVEPEVQLARVVFGGRLRDERCVRVRSNWSLRDVLEVALGGVGGLSGGVFSGVLDLLVGLAVDVVDEDDVRHGAEEAVQQQEDQARGHDGADRATESVAL